MQELMRQIFSPRNLGLAGLCLLAWVYLILFRYDSFGIEEGAARALLLNWSIAHQIASPIALYGVPDLRSILFIILDLHWAGSLAAAKVFTMLILFGSALILYRWNESQAGDESAMIATALLLISPVALMQTDAIGSGIYLLGAFAVFQPLEHAFKQSDRALSSWYFLLIVLTAFSVSLHPMGLAMPAVLLWVWRSELLKAGKGRYLLIGILSATIVMLLLRWGWHGMESTEINPLALLANVFLGPELIHKGNQWEIGLIPATLLAIVAVAHLWKRASEPLSLLLLAASIIGLTHPDTSWSLIAYATLLYLGIPQLVRFNQRYGWSGLVGQRGMVLLLVMVTATISMSTLRHYRAIGENGLKSATDSVIAVLAQEAEDTKAPFVAASQWPARTVLATRRDVLPLPPATEDPATFAKQIKGLTHLAFNPYDPDMHKLARNAAALSHKLETIALLPGGVVLKARQPDTK